MDFLDKDKWGDLGYIKLPNGVIYQNFVFC